MLGALRVTPIAWLALIHDRVRLISSLVGVTFAVFIMFIQMGFLNGVYDSQTDVVHKLDADLVIVNRLKDSFLPTQPFSRRRIEQARALPGVASVYPLYIDEYASHWKSLDDGGRSPILTLGFDPDGPALFHAAVQLGGGSGEFVSSQGLILTNHHVAFAAIQALSSAEDNYVEDGFHARGLEEEGRADYRGTLTLGVEDVTDQVLAGLPDGATEKEREDHVTARRKAIVERARAEAGAGHHSFRVVEYFNGVKKLIEKEGYLVFATQVDPFNSVENRAKQVAEQIDGYMKEVGAKKVHLVGHSQGGLDARWKINDQHQLRAQYLYSDTEYPDQVAQDFEQPVGAFGGAAAQLQYNYSSRNWWASGRYELRDDHFRADSGFETRVDYDQYTAAVGRVWHGEEDNWWTRQQINADYDISHDTNGQLLEREFEAYYSINGPMQWFAQFGGLTRDVYFDGQIFRENKVSLYTQFQPRGGLFFGVWSRVGDQIDFSNTRLGDQIRVQPEVNWNVNEHLLLRLRSSWVRLDSKEGPNIFDATVHDVRLTWQFSNRSFLRLTTQYRTVDRNQAMYLDDVDAKSRNAGRQLLYSYKLNPQTVFFLGYSDSHIDDDDLDDPTVTDRTFFLKVGYAWMP